MRKEDFTQDNICKSFQRKLGIFIMLIATILMLIVCYMAWFPMKIIDLKSLELIDKNGNIQTKVKQGEMLTYRLTFRKYQNLASEIHVQVVNHYIISYPLRVTNLAVTDPEKIRKGEWDIANAIIAFPYMAVPGEHYIILTLVYKINIFREERYSICSDRFQVLKEKGGEYTSEMPLVINKIN